MTALAGTKSAFLLSVIYEENARTFAPFSLLDRHRNRHIVTMCTRSAGWNGCRLGNKWQWPDECACWSFKCCRHCCWRFSCVCFGSERHPKRDLCKTRNFSNQVRFIRKNRTATFVYAIKIHFEGSLIRRFLRSTLLLIMPFAIQQSLPAVLDCKPLP